jgi:hypothetical protein
MMRWLLGMDEVAMDVYRFPSIFAPRWHVSIYLDRAERWRIAEIERALVVHPVSPYQVKTCF